MCSCDATESRWLEIAASISAELNRPENVSTTPEAKAAGANICSLLRLTVSLVLCLLD